MVARHGAALQHRRCGLIARRRHMHLARVAIQAIIPGAGHGMPGWHRRG